MILYLFFNLIIHGAMFASILSTAGVTFARRRQGYRVDLPDMLWRLAVTGGFSVWTAWLLSRVV
jgi:hypothetical protein